MIYLTALVNFEQGNLAQASQIFDQSLQAVEPNCPASRGK